MARAFDWQSKGNRFDSDILHRAVLKTAFFFKGVVAHLVEHLVRNQKVVGSSPIYSTKAVRHPSGARRGRKIVVGIEETVKYMGHPFRVPFLF